MTISSLPVRLEVDPSNNDDTPVYHSTMRTTSDEAPTTRNKELLELDLELDQTVVLFILIFIFVVAPIGLNSNLGCKAWSFVGVTGFQY
jgi:hypothetical protein